MGGTKKIIQLNGRNNVNELIVLFFFNGVLLEEQPSIDI